MSKPDLKTWTQERLSALYTAQDDDSFQSAFEDAFAPEGKAKVSVNGEDIPRDKFKDEIRGQRTAMTKADIKFDEVQEDEGPEKALKGEGGNQFAVIKGSWTVTRSLKFRVRAAPAQMQRISTFEAKVEPKSPGSNDFCIVHLTETVENKHKPVIINPVRHNEGSESQD